MNNLTKLRWYEEWLIYFCCLFMAEVIAAFIVTSYNEVAERQRSRLEFETEQKRKNPLDVPEGWIDEVIKEAKEAQEQSE